VLLTETIHWTRLPIGFSRLGRLPNESRPEDTLSSYIVRTLDISSLLAKAEQIVLQSGGELKFVNRSLIAVLREHPRVQYFYYCDDREGITLRLFDEEISRSYAHVFSRKTKVFFRGKKLGVEGGRVKSELLALWDEVQPRPSGLGVGSIGETEQYFKNLNSKDSEPHLIQESVSLLLEDFLSKFDAIRKSAPYGKHPVLWPLIGQLKAAISAFPAMESRPQIRLSWSLGAGNWANIPWIALLDERETHSTERDVYVVFLFRQDMSGVYLCLSQGVTDVFKQFGRTAGNTELTTRAEAYRKFLRNLPSLGFDLSAAPDLRTDGALGNAYERGTIAHKLYETGSVPADSVLADDLSHLLDAYGAVLESSFEAPTVDKEPATDDSRIWVYAPGDNAEHWNELYEAKLMAIGWDELGDLQQYETFESMSEALVQTYNRTTQPINDARATWDFARLLKPGDEVFAKRGRHTIVGRGIVEGAYEYSPDRPSMPNVRSIRWIDRGEWEIGINLPVKTLTDVTNNGELVEAMRKLMSAGVKDPIVSVPVDQRVPYTIENALDGLFMPRQEFEAALSVWKVKHNLILQGAPGVGKSFVARRLAYSLMGFNDPSRVRTVQFHQAYAYEDFVQGYRPSGSGGFSLKEGVFVEFCRRALADPGETYVFVIDEINRGNLSKVLGELMLLIESDKRSPEWAVKLAYGEKSDERFYVPPNLYLLGMMNTADRSLAVVDYALRRRFGFWSIKPGFTEAAFGTHLEGRGVSASMVERIRTRMRSLNEAIASDRTNLGPGFCIGHSFYSTPPTSLSDLADGNRVEAETAWFMQVIESEIAPLLDEYCFDDPERADEWCQNLRS
jgi:hypothetical protein